MENNNQSERKQNLSQKYIIPEKTKLTPGYGWYLGELPLGCQLCMKGMKVVYFMGGDCNHPSHCRWYCPISENRQKSYIHYADEIPIENPNSVEEILPSLLDEFRKTNARGMSFTGGEPLRTPGKINLVSQLIKAIKIEMGDSFHIHLYTSGQNFDSHTADKLEKAGLDEIRFHPAEKDFYKLEFAAERKYRFGAEVPVIPTEENHLYLLKLADYLESIGADFINLNEFEICAPNQKALQKRGFTLRKGDIAAIDGSREYAEKFIKEFNPNGISIHFCPVAVKDSVQIRNRYHRRAENIARPFEDITDDGTLLFLRIEGGTKSLEDLYNYLTKESGMPKHLLEYEKEKGILDLPSFLADDEMFLGMLREYKVKAGVVEILPFRNPKVFQIVEYSPIQDLRPHSELWKNRS